MQYIRTDYTFGLKELNQLAYLSECKYAQLTKIKINVCDAIAGVHDMDCFK